MPSDGGLARTPAEAAPRVGIQASFRGCEKILFAYFVYAGLLTSARALPAARIALAWLIPVAIAAAIWGLALPVRPWVGVVRDWLPLALLLAGYWEMQWFSSAHVVAWQNTWLGWDRHLLNGWGLRAAVEALGPVIPAILEGTYLCLYGIPVFCIAALYFFHRRERIDRFLTTLFLGAYGAYALLPMFPSVSPRLAFPGTDLPHYESVFRTLNVWLLNHLDISTSVFPSGHVAVAFSCAFGLWRALPEKRGLSAGLFVISTVVYLATIYSRYHYAVDGLAGAAIAVIAWRSSDWVEQHV